MTGTEFRTLHGDPTTWTTTDIESQQNLAEIDALKTTAAHWAGETPEHTLRTRLTFQAHGLYRAVRNTGRAIRRHNHRTSTTA